MKLLFVCDGRSPIALNWVRYFAEGRAQVHLVSLYPAAPDLPLQSLHHLPIAFSGLTGSGTEPGSDNWTRRWLQKIAPPPVRTALRQRIVPLTLPAASRRLQTLIEALKPDLVHAMRIPYEGMLASAAISGLPLLISVWGNDFTLHAPSTARMAQLTRQSLQRADALHVDCQRDVQLALQWGFSPDKPTVVLPGGGGVRRNLFYPPPDLRRRGDSATEEERPLIMNPRGARAYVRNDTFFRAIPLVLQMFPGARFVCPALEADAEAHRWLSALNIAHAVALLPYQSLHDLAGWYRRALIAVSPTTHDGTPNSLLEAMACGTFPIAGDLESLREWIVPGENGLLFDPNDPADLAQAIIQALKQPALRESAASRNFDLIARRAAYEVVMPQAEAFYGQIVGAG